MSIFCFIRATRCIPNSIHEVGIFRERCRIRLRVPIVIGAVESLENRSRDFIRIVPTMHNSLSSMEYSRQTYRCANSINSGPTLGSSVSMLSSDVEWLCPCSILNHGALP
jgi:hypothetical protein